MLRPWSARMPGNPLRTPANIRDAMVVADPVNAPTYRTNASAYLAKPETLDQEVRKTLAAIPVERRKVISTHDADAPNRL